MKPILLNFEHVNQCFEFDKLERLNHWSYKIWEKGLNEINSLNAGIFLKKELISLASASVILDELHLTYISVKKNYRKKSYGLKTLMFLLNLSRSRDLKRVTLEVNEKNQAAIGLYKKIGFIHSGTRKRYYPSGDNAFILWFDL